MNRLRGKLVAGVASLVGLDPTAVMNFRGDLSPEALTPPRPLPTARCSGSAPFSL